MKVNTIARAVGAAIGATALALSATALPAAADPSPAEEFRTLVGVGSDTTQDALNAFGALLDGGDLIASWDARPTVPGSSTQITTRDPGANPNCNGGTVPPGQPATPDDGIVRPNGSTQGRQALFASQNDPAGATWQGEIIIGCVDFARSSAYPTPANPQTEGAYTFIPFGVDAVSIAKHQDSNLPNNWTLPLLRAIYNCTITSIGSLPVRPALPQAGSGTRQFWLQQMNLTEAQVGASPCIIQTYDHDSNPGTAAIQIQEHDGRPLTQLPAGTIVPFSVGQWIAQGNSAAIATATNNEVVVENRVGPAELNTIGGQSPFNLDGTLNTNYPVRRDVYNVVPTANLSDPLIASTFVGSGSLVCAADSGAGLQGEEITELLGFGTRAASADLLNQACGSTTLRHPRA